MGKSEKSGRCFIKSRKKFLPRKWNFFPQKRHSEILGSSKEFPFPPNSAPGLRHCVATYGALGHVPSSFGNFVHSAAAASLTVKISTFFLIVSKNFEIGEVLHCLRGMDAPECT